MQWVVAMDCEARFVQPDSRGRLKTHLVILDGATISRWHGLLGGKITEVPADTYVAINVGQANEKSPKQVAKERFDKLCSDITRDGYTQVAEWPTETRVAVDKTLDVQWVMSMPSALCVSKPISEISQKKFQQLGEAGCALITVKENGLCHLAFIQDTLERSRIMTRRMFDHTTKYPDIMKALHATFPAGTLVVIELFVDAPVLSHTNRFKLMSSISKADTSSGKLIGEPVKTQALRALHTVRARLLSVPVCAYRDTTDVLSSIEAIPNTTLPPELAKMAYPPMYTSVQEYVDWCKAHREEGVVVWDLSASMEITGDGKAVRRAAYKIKPAYDLDVIATGWVPEKNKDGGRIGALQIVERVDGELVDRGTVGSGLTDLDRDPSKWVFPCVVAIEFKERFEDTGNFQHPVFVKVHEDKTPDTLQ